MKIQLCFTIGSKEQNEIILNKLRKLKEDLNTEFVDDYTIHSCHLPKAVIIEKNFDIMISDGFEEIFGDKYNCEIKENSFEEAMSKMNEYRVNLAKSVGRLIILSDQPVSNVALELQYFTENRVLFL